MKKTANTSKDTLRKAAILVASLDHRSADALLDQMGPEQAARVRNAVMELGEISLAEQECVIEEFMRGGPAAARNQDTGIELDGALAAKFAMPHAALAAPNDGHVAVEEKPPFRFLHEAGAETLANFLLREHPQTVAVVVSHLPADRAAEVLAQLPGTLQAEVLRRLVELEETSPEIIREIEQGLASLLTDQTRVVQRRSAGMAAASAILAAAAIADRKDILANLARRDGNLAAQLGRVADSSSHDRPIVPHSADIVARSHARQSVGDEQFHPRSGERGYENRVTPERTRHRDEFENDEEIEQADSTLDDASDEQDVEQSPDIVVEFDELVEFDNRSLATLLRAADARLTILALTGARRELIDRLLRQLPSREAKSLRRQMEQQGPLRLSDVDQAQQQLARLAGELAARGEIRLPTRHRVAMVA
jgi:flagellar motor switch protein FliG